MACWPAPNVAMAAAAAALAAAKRDPATSVACMLADTSRMRTVRS